MLGRTVDENFFWCIAFGQGGAQFKFADDFEALALPAPPAQQRRDGLRFAEKTMASNDFRLPIANCRFETSPIQRRVEFCDSFRDWQRGEKVKRRGGRKQKRLANKALPEDNRFGSVTEVWLD